LLHFFLFFQAILTPQFTTLSPPSNKPTLELDAWVVAAASIRRVLNEAAAKVFAGKPELLAKYTTSLLEQGKYIYFQLNVCI